MPELTTTLRNALDALPTKAARIRALSAYGLRQAEIARHLGVSDQHVSHVLIRSKKAGIAPEALPASDDSGTFGLAQGARLMPDMLGRIILMPEVLGSLGLKPSEGLVVTTEGRSLRLVPADAALQRARDLVRAFDIGAGSPVDELLAERRREAAE